MNCETFQTILQDLGRDFPVDLQMRQHGLAHAEQCPECAARLKDECRLVAGLGALAASFTDAKAPPKVQEALLKAFRNRMIEQEVEKLRDSAQVMQVPPNRSSANNSPLTPSPPPPLGERGEDFLLDTHSFPRAEGARREGEGTCAGALGEDSKSSPRFWNGWPVRVAAISLLVFGLSAWFFWQNPSRKPDEVVDRLKPSLPEGVSQVLPPKALSPESVVVPKMTRAHSLEAKTGQRAARERVVRIARSQKPVRQSDPKGSEVEDYATLDQTEVATEFLPLTYGDPISSSLEGGQLVRVQLPRATLLSFGFPMSEERAPEPIKADVLLGEDGMARAIRFVH
jgi:hypothetical protein